MYYMTLDIGTTTIKGILYDENGIVQKEVAFNPKTFSSAPGYMEQSVEEVISFATGAIKELAKYSFEKGEKIGFVSLSSYMHSLIAVDQNGKELTNIIMWSDNRSEDYANEYMHNEKGYKIFELTGTPIHPMSPLYKLMWLRDNQKEIFNSAAKFISIKEYLVKNLTGKYYVDYSIASATGLFNIHDLNWEPKALKELSITEERLSTPVATTFKVDLLPDITECLGLNDDTVVVMGGSDGCLANLGSRGLDEGNAVVTIGTSAAVRIVTKKPIIDESARLFSYAMDSDFYVSGGALNNGGVVFAWFKELFGNDFILDDVFKGYDDENNGLLFLPFLNGERAPYWNPKLKGAYLGINHSHKEIDFLYSTIQGICFAIKDVFEILKDKHTGVKRIFANGGFTKSDFWINRLSSVLGYEVDVLNQGDAACFGAFLVGLKAFGIIDNWMDCERYFDKPKTYKSDTNATDELMFEIYKQSIEMNTKVLAKLSDIQTNKF